MRHKQLILPRKSHMDDLWSDTACMALDRPPTPSTSLHASLAAQADHLHATLRLPDWASLRRVQQPQTLGLLIGYAAALTLTPRPHDLTVLLWTTLSSDEPTVTWLLSGRGPLGPAAVPAQAAEWMTLAEGGNRVLLAWNHPSRVHLQLLDEATPDPANVVTAGVFAGQGPVLTPDEAAERRELRLDHLQQLTQARTVRGELSEPGLLGQVLQSPEIAPPAGLLRALSRTPAAQLKVRRRSVERAWARQQREA
jgi:hypothetical protein